MRLFNSRLLIVLVTSFFLLANQQEVLAQKEEAASIEVDIAKMTVETQAALDSMVLDLCKCLNQHGKIVRRSLDEAIYLLQEAQNKEDANLKETSMQVRSIMVKTRPFSQCLGEAKKKNLTLASSQELQKVAGDPAVERQKYTAILSSLLAKSCPNENGQEILQLFMDFGDQIEALQNKGKE